MDAYQKINLMRKTSMAITSFSIKNEENIVNKNRKKK